MNTNAKKVYKGYFNYYVGGVLKTHHFERKEGLWILKFEKLLRQRHGETNYKGYMAVEDERGLQVIDTTQPSIFANRMLNLNRAFQRFTKSYL